MCNHTLYPRINHFCCCCLQAFSTEEILKCYIKNCFKINGKKRLQCLKNMNISDSKIMKEK